MFIVAGDLASAHKLMRKLWSVCLWTRMRTISMHEMHGRPSLVVQGKFNCNISEQRFWYQWIDMQHPCITVYL